MPGVPEGRRAAMGSLRSGRVREPTCAPPLSQLQRETKLQGAQGRRKVKLLDLLNGGDMRRAACARWWRGV
jgi:hypothetical protein